MTVAPSTRPASNADRSEEHTSELQSPCNLVCRLLLEKKKQSPLHRPFLVLHRGVERVRRMPRARTLATAEEVDLVCTHSDPCAELPRRPDPRFSASAS